jgi:hypothetical protein
MYNPQNAKECVGLPPDTIYTGVIVDIQDRKVKDFVKSEDIGKWKKPEQNAINVCFEVIHNGQSYKVFKIFTYAETNGTTEYGSKSDLGKFKAKYGKLPTMGDQAKFMTNKDGFLRLKLD